MNFRKLPDEFKKSVSNIDGKALISFCTVFIVVCFAMCGVNILAQSARMAWITGGLGSVMLFSMVLYKLTKKLLPVVIALAGAIFVMMLYFIVNGGENGFSSVWMLLVPPVAMYFIQLYCGSLFSLILGLAATVYLWSPLRELGYEYTITYAIRFPLVYWADFAISFIMQHQIGKSRAQQEEAYRRAESANAAKGVFLSNMSHEVRTPINAILGYNEMILKESQESNTISYATNIQTAGRVLLSMVSDTIDYVSIQDGKLYLEKEPYSVYSVLQDIIAYGSYHAEKKKIDFRFEMDENLPQELVGDSVRLTQICNNLLSNAIKYTNAGYVLLKFEWEKKEPVKGILKVSVQDTGIGIKKENMDKIADGFTRIDERDMKNVQGIGMGLPLVTKFLEMQGSKLEIESIYGQGSVFSFEIEQEIAAPEAIGKLPLHQKQKTVEEQLYRAPEAKVLIVDDNMMNLELLRGLLLRIEVRPDFAMNGEEALDRIRENLYDLVLMDHMMPILDGMEAMAIIREEKLCQSTPVIVLTANAVIGAKEMYIGAGFDDYLTKPVSGEKLYAAVRRFLRPELIKDVQKEQLPVCEKKGEHGLLEKLSFLDTKTGMAYCMDDEEFYREMLQTFLKNEKLEDIEAFYELKDWNNYRILVHALKSASLSIGAVQLSDGAKQLEIAAKEENSYYIDSHHSDVMKEYRSVLEGIADGLSEKKEEPAEEVPTELSAHILVVDDDAMNLKIAEKMLQKYFEVSLAESGKEALKLLEHTMPDMILLDLHMPEMDGFEIMHLLQSQERLKEIPVVFLTADNDREVEVRGFKEGAQDFITKPFIAEIMIQRVSRILELSRLQKNLQKEVAKQTRRAEERREKVERLSEQIMKTLAGTIDAKDKYTNGHSTRVAQYSLEIARRAGKDEKEQERIYFMGMLHDIGKIGIPDTIITKSSGLSDEEYALIRSHVVIGAEILENISEIPDLGVGARWHHERYDGKGYPDGIAGEEIPEEARIIAVADAYDAMASKRSYRDVLPQQVVYEEIKKGAGMQFDPVFAQLMLQMIEEDTAYDMREK